MRSNAPETRPVELTIHSPSVRESDTFSVPTGCAYTKMLKTASPASGAGIDWVVMENRGAGGASSATIQ